MTDRLKGCWVTFDHDVRDEDATPILEAIRMVRGVASVEESVADHRDHSARIHVRQQIREKLQEVYDSLG